MKHIELEEGGEALTVTIVKDGVPVAEHVVHAVFTSLAHFYGKPGLIDQSKCSPTRWIVPDKLPNGITRCSAPTHIE